MNTSEDNVNFFYHHYRCTSSCKCVYFIFLLRVSDSHSNLIYLILYMNVYFFNVYMYFWINEKKNPTISFSGFKNGINNRMVSHQQVRTWPHFVLFPLLNISNYLFYWEREREREQCLTILIYKKLENMYVIYTIFIEC